MACDFLHETVNGGLNALRFQLGARIFLTTSTEQSLRSAIDILDALESKGHIAPGRYDDLKELVKPIHVGIVELIEDTEREIQALYADSGARGKIINIHVQCKII